MLVAAQAAARRAATAEPTLMSGLSRLAAATATSTTAKATIPAGKPPAYKEFQLYRYNPEQDEKPYYKAYKVDINKCAARRVSNRPRPDFAACSPRDACSPR